MQELYIHINPSAFMYVCLCIALEQYKKPQYHKDGIPSSDGWFCCMFRPFRAFIKAWKGQNIVQQNQSSELSIPSLWYQGKQLHYLEQGHESQAVKLHGMANLAGCSALVVEL